MYVYKRK